MKSWVCTHLCRDAAVAVVVATDAVAVAVAVATGAVAPVVGIPSYFERTLRQKQTGGVQRGSWLSYFDHFKDWFVSRLLLRSS